MDGTLAMLDDPRHEPRFARRVLLENARARPPSCVRKKKKRSEYCTTCVCFAKTPFAVRPPSRYLSSLTNAPKKETLFLFTHAGMYVLVSICSGSSLISTSNRSCTASSTAESSSDPMKVMARPLVPKRPALPTRCR